VDGVACVECNVLRGQVGLSRWLVRRVGRLGGRKVDSQCDADGSGLVEVEWKASRVVEDLVRDWTWIEMWMLDVCCWRCFKNREEKQATWLECKGKSRLVCVARTKGAPDAFTCPSRSRSNSASRTFPHVSRDPSRFLPSEFLLVIFHPAKTSILITRTHNSNIRPQDI
jgi:hypothetical protein